MKKMLATSLLSLPLLYGAGATLLTRNYDKTIIRKLPASDAIHLTFDDGPHPIYTVKLLDILRKYDAKATFFVVGSLVEKYPHIIKLMAQEGHSIGIHHYTHTSSWQLTPAQLQQHIAMTAQAIRIASGVHTTLYRPPWGHFNAAGPFVIKNYSIILWSRIYNDWKESSHQLRKLREPIPNGAILLLHDNGNTRGADAAAPANTLHYVEELLRTSTQSFKAIPYDN